MLVGGPLDGQYRDVRGPVFEIAMPTEQWPSMASYDDYTRPVPFRRGIYKPKVIAFAVPGGSVSIEVLAYYGTRGDEGR